MDDNLQTYGAPKTVTESAPKTAPEPAPASVAQSVDLRTGLEQVAELEEDVALAGGYQNYGFGDTKSAVENFVESKAADVIDLRSAGSQESEVSEGFSYKFKKFKKLSINHSKKKQTFH